MDEEKKQSCLEIHMAVASLQTDNERSIEFMKHVRHELKRHGEDISSIKTDICYTKDGIDKILSVHEKNNFRTTVMWKVFLFAGTGVCGVIGTTIIAGKKAVLSFFTMLLNVI